eukprot:3316413-Amphidinium_carterae.1
MLARYGTERMLTKSPTSTAIVSCTCCGGLNLGSVTHTHTHFLGSQPGRPRWSGKSLDKNQRISAWRLASYSMPHCARGRN